MNRSSTAHYDHQRIGLTIVAIWIILFLSASSYGIYVIFIDTHNIQNYRYQINIFPGNDSLYDIIVPAPLNHDESVSNIIHKIHIIDGKMTYNPIETNGTHGLEIIGRGNTVLLVQENRDDQEEIEVPSKLSLFHHEGLIYPSGYLPTDGYFLFCNSTATNIKIYFSLEVYSDTGNFFHGGHLDYLGECKGTLSNGWSFIKGISVYKMS